jgi:hypothetical protein
MMQRMPKEDNIVLDLSSTIRKGMVNAFCPLAAKRVCVWVNKEAQRKKGELPLHVAVRGL